ncbi:MAG: hypothetical protein GY943_35090, partial [Chloroflexi bacterium]|nr:hypothetical protein [Chloroflexota bacterium]
AGTFGWLVGTGDGAGMGLIIVVSGLLVTAVGFGAYFFPVVRNAESLLPDHEQTGGVEEESGADLEATDPAPA